MNVLNKKIVFICIGNSNIIGDCLGPLIGSYIIQNIKDFNKKKLIEVVGTMENPIGYNNLDFLEYVKEKNNVYIVIDSALGNKKYIGKIIINSKVLYAGKGLNKNFIIYGDYIIKGIVGNNFNNKILNLKELYNVQKSQIEEIANKIIKYIIPNLLDSI